MLKILAPLAIALAACATVPAVPHEVSSAKPGDPHAMYNVDLTDVGISLTMPNAKWKTAVDEHQPVLNISRPGYDVEMHVTLVTLPRIGALEEELADQRRMIVQGHADSGVKVGTIEDYGAGRRGFEMTKDMPDKSVKMMVMIFAPAPNQPDKAVLILSVGERTDMLKLRKAMRFIVETIRPLKAPSAMISPPESETP